MTLVAKTAKLETKDRSEILLTCSHTGFFSQGITNPKKPKVKITGIPGTMSEYSLNGTPVYRKATCVHRFTLHRNLANQTNLLSFC